NVLLAEKNAEINGVSDRFKAVHLNVKDVKSAFYPGEFDIAVSNPPFIEVGRGTVSRGSHRAVARQELLATLEDFIKAASYLLKNRGRFYLLLPTVRFVDGICLCRRYALEPKRLRFIYPQADREANLFLLECLKGGGKGIIIEPPLVVYRDSRQRVYTDEVERKYETFLPA
ncbi:MAG: methyltransferase, partial [Desulfurobacteriaceae bacterium]